MAQITAAPWTTDGQIQIFPVTPSTHSPQALAYLARTVGGNEGGNATNIATLIDGLVSDGVWSKLDCLYVLAQQNETDAKLNLIGTSYGLTQIGTIRLRPTPNIGTLIFTPYRGFNGFNTVGSYLDTGFNAAIAPSPKFTQNSANYGFWSLGGVTSESCPAFGNSANAISGESQIYNKFTDGTFYVRLNNPVAGGSSSPGIIGFFAGDRSTTTTIVPYFNSVAQPSQAATSQAVFSGTFTIGNVANAVNAGSSQQLSAAFIGASLGAVGQLALYNRLRTYTTAIGGPHEVQNDQNPCPWPSYWLWRPLPRPSKPTSSRHAATWPRWGH